MADVMHRWRALAQFHMVPKHFKQSKMSIEGHTNIKLYFYKLVTFVQTVYSQGRLNKSQQEVYEQMHTALDNFCERMSAQ